MPDKGLRGVDSDVIVTINTIDSDPFDSGCDSDSMITEKYMK